MTQREAIQILGQVVAQTRATAQEHNVMAEALKVLMPKPEKENAEKAAPKAEAQNARRTIS